MGDITSEEDLSSEALTTTLSEDTSLPTSLRRHLQELQVEQLSSFSELLIGGVPPLEAGQVKDLLGEAQVDDSTSEEEVLEDDEVLSKEIKLNATSLVSTTADAIPSPKKAEVAIPSSQTSAEDAADIKGACRKKPELNDHEKELLSQDKQIPTPQEEAEAGIPSVEAQAGIIQSQKMLESAKDRPSAVQLQNDAETAMISSQPVQHTELDQKIEVVETGHPAQVVEPKIKSAAGSTQPLPTVPDSASLVQKTNFPDNIVHKKDVVTQEKPLTPVTKEVTFKLPADAPISSETGGEGSSEATETGADVSDFVSFAEENHIQAEADAKELSGKTGAAKGDQAFGGEDEESESVCKGQETQTSLSFQTPVTQSKEHSTQTDEEHGITVVGLNTSFHHHKDGAETQAGSRGPVQSQEVTEILLDAHLPSETQLLVKDAKVVGSTPVQNVEIEASEAGAVPCIVTSHVSLAFLGMEHCDELGSSSHTITPTKEGQDTASLTNIAKDLPKQECHVPSVKHKEIDLLASEPKLETGSAPLTSPLTTSISTLKSDHNVIDQVCHKDSETTRGNETKAAPKDAMEAVNGEGKTSVQNNITPSTKVNQKQTLIDPNQQTVPRPSGPKSSHIHGEKDRNSNFRSPTQTLQSRENLEVSQDAEPLPVSPSLEAIAESVAASTTRAALELLATATMDTFTPHQASHPASQTEEVPSEQLPVSTDESSATTVVVVSDVGKNSGASFPKSATKTLAHDTSPNTSPEYVSTTTRTPSDSPASRPMDEITQESVEAALAEAVQEEVLSSPQKSAVPQEVTPQKVPETATVSPVRSSLALVWLIFAR